MPVAFIVRPDSFLQQIGTVRRMEGRGNIIKRYKLIFAT